MTHQQLTFDRQSAKACMMGTINSRYICSYHNDGSFLFSLYGVCVRRNLMKVFLKIVIGLILVYTILIILHFVFDFKIIDTLINAGVVTIPTIVLILEIEYDH